MWKAVEDILTSVDPSTLDLRLNRVRDINETELFDTDLRFIDVPNLHNSGYLVCRLDGI